MRKGLEELNALRRRYGVGPTDGKNTYSPTIGLITPEIDGGKPVEWFASSEQLSEEAREERCPGGTE